MRSAEALDLGEWRRSARGRTRVLVAEEDDFLRERIADALRDDGYEVVEAEDGFEVLDTPAVDLIVADAMLSGYDGLEVLERLRRNGIATPFVLMSHGPDDATWREAERLGADLVIGSPWDIDEVRNAVFGLSRTY